MSGRILKRLGISRLSTSQRYKRHETRWKRYEKAEPGHRIQVDVKFLERIPSHRKRYYPFTAIDDCTRLRVLKIYERNNQKTAIQFLDYVLSRLPFRIEVVQRLRQPTWSSHLAQAVLTLRERYPRWGKGKLALLLRRQ